MAISENRKYVVEENFLLCQLDGYIDASNHQMIKNEIDKQIFENYELNNVILDIANVKHVSATGITVFEHILKIVNPRNGRLEIFNAANTVKEIIAMYGFIDKFNFRVGIPVLREIHQKHQQSKTRFPLNFRCPACGFNTSADSPGEVRCGSCKSVFSIGVNGAILYDDNKQTTQIDVELPVKIYGEEELVEVIRSKNEYERFCISIGNPGQEIPEEIKNGFEKLLRIEFFDVDDVSTLSDTQVKRIPELEDARKVIEFIDDTEGNDASYAIHCWQGVSRSTAVGIAVLFLLTKKVDNLEEIITTIRPNAYPHKKLLSYFDALLSTDLNSIGEKIREKRRMEMKAELERIKMENT